MADAATLRDLIARVEAAGPDRGLDARVFMLIEGGSEADADYAASNPEVTCRPPAYTASLDAALTLVPAKWEWTLVGPEWGCWMHRNREAPSIGGRKAKSAALALCAAALRARLAEMEARND